MPLVPGAQPACPGGGNLLVLGNSTALKPINNMHVQGDNLLVLGNGSGSTKPPCLGDGCKLDQCAKLDTRGVYDLILHVFLIIDKICKV